MALNDDAKLILTGSFDKTAILYELRLLPIVQIFQGHTGPVESVALSGDGKQVVSASGGETILWETASGKKIKTLPAPKGGLITGMDLSGDGQKILTGATDNTAILWDAASGQKLKTFSKGHKFIISCVAPERQRQACRHRIARQDGNLVVGGHRHETPSLRRTHGAREQRGGERRRHASSHRVRG